MSSDPRAVMRLIGGVEPTAEQVQRVQAIAHSLGISSDDAMLPILLALETYHGAFSRLPGETVKLAEKLLAQFEKTAERQKEVAERKAFLMMSDTVAQLVKELKPAVSMALDEMEVEVQRKERWKWVAICLTVALVGLSGFGMIVHTTGHKAGYTDGYAAGNAAGYERSQQEKPAVQQKQKALLDKR